MYRIIGVVLLLFVSLTHTVTAQNPLEEKARAELEKRGLEEEAVRERLLLRGIDIDNIDPNDPAQLLSIEKELEAVIAELEAEKAASTNGGTGSPNPRSSGQDLSNVEIDTAAATLETVKKADIESVVAEELTELQDDLPPTVIFGQHIFRDKSIKLYRQSEDIKPPDSYVLGVGDVIAVSIFGISQKSAVYEINNSGYISPATMPRVYLKGLPFGKAKELLLRRFSQYYNFTPEEFEVSINYSRTITVNLVGELINYGSFTIPAINTAFNALVAAGGPSDIGSVRKIKLMRAGEQARNIDIYEFLLNPSVQAEYYLQENDYIHVPVADRLVSIQGAVKRPFKYELVQGENLNKLIEFAGGFQPNAYLSNIKIKRFVNDEEVIIDLNYNDLLASDKDFDVLNGDEVIIRKIPKPYKNFVEITGEVEFADKYELTPGMRLSDLINKGVLTEQSYLNIAFIQRSNQDETVRYEKVDINNVLSNPESEENLVLQPQDRLLIYNKSRFTDKAVFSISGAVRKPITYPFSVGKELKVNDAVVLAGGLLPDATPFAYIRRINKGNSKKRRYIRVDLQTALTDPSSDKNLTIEPFDELIVYSTERFTDESVIEVSGAVRTPGEIQYAENFSLKDVLTMAGGLKLEASKSRIDIFRIIIKDNAPTETVVATLEVDDELNVVSGDGTFELAPFDMVIVRRVPEFEFQNVVTITGEVKYPGAYPLIADNEKIKNIIQRCGGLTAEAFPAGATLYRSQENIGFIVLDLDEVLKDENAVSNFILKEGDVIDIPKQKDLVTIKGATKANELYPEKVIAGGKINVAFHNKKSAKWYVDQYAAGVGDNGKRKLITVEHPNGEIERTKNFLFFKDYPSVRKGSVISVGTKPIDPVKEKEKEEREKVDWGKTLAESIAQATAILSLILLVQQVNR